MAMFPNSCVLFLLVASLGFAQGFKWFLLDDDECEDPKDKKCQTAWESEANLRSMTLGPSGDCGEVSYDCMKEIITDKDSVEFFKAPADSSVFWSGDEMTTAQNWAARQNPRKYTLEQTLGGNVLNSLELFKLVQDYDWDWLKLKWEYSETRWGDTGDKAAEIFDEASKYFAKNAAGDVNVFAHCQAKTGCKGQLRTWWRLEAPEIKNNAAVRNIMYRKSDGTVLKSITRANFDPTKEYVTGNEKKR